MLQGHPLHCLKQALHLFTDTSKEGWCAHLNSHTARGMWSLPESKLIINYLELKAVFLALKEFQDLCKSNIVLIATENTTVVAYINQGDEIRPSVCPSVENPDLVYQQTGYSQSPTHPRSAEHGSRQAIQTRGWSLLEEVFQAICNRWHQSQIDLFATRFININYPSLCHQYRTP